MLGAAGVQSKSLLRGQISQQETDIEKENSSIHIPLHSVSHIPF